MCTYSGGKDSDVMLELFKRSGVQFEVHNSHTTADAPQTVHHIRDVFRDLVLQGIKCNIDYHVQLGGNITMWNLIPKKLMPPTRKVRYCCTILKETGCRNRMIATGVRTAESKSRESRTEFEAIGKTKKDAVRVTEKMLLTDNDKSRMLFERCEIKAKTVVNPILDWEDNEIWDFYWNECEKHNVLYKMGFYRVGCIGCPMANKTRWREFRIFPEYKRLYIHAFDRMIEVRKLKGKYCEWKSGEEVFIWWMEDKNVEGQMNLFEDGFIS